MEFNGVYINGGYNSIILYSECILEENSIGQLYIIDWWWKSLYWSQAITHVFDTQCFEQQGGENIFKLFFIELKFFLIFDWRSLLHKTLHIKWACYQIWFFMGRKKTLDCFSRVQRWTFIHRFENWSVSRYKKLLF